MKATSTRHREREREAKRQRDLPGDGNVLYDENKNMRIMVNH